VAAQHNNLALHLASTELTHLNAALLAQEAKMNIALHPIAIATASVEDVEGRLVLVDGRLAGVLVLLQDELYGELGGRWFLEAAFGHFEDGACEIFASLDDAIRWFSSSASQIN
jgi:hypothetical protein